MLFAVGDVKVAEKDVRAGYIVPGGTVVRTGEKSLADFQYREPRMAVTVRLGENSQYLINAHQHEKEILYFGVLQSGRSKLRIDRKTATSESFTLTAPTATASVRGTMFDAAVDEILTTQFTVHEGIIAMRRRIPGLESLPATAFEASPELRGIIAELEKKELILEAGMSGTAQKVDERPVAAEIERIQAEMKPYLLPDGSLNPRTAEDAAEKIRTNRPAELEALRKFASELPGPSQGSDRLSGEALKLAIAEYTELVGLDQSSLRDDKQRGEAIKKRTEGEREELQTRIENIFHQAS